MNLWKIGKRMAIALSLALFMSGAWGAQATYRLHVDGLACPFCAYGIEKQLNAVKGVQRIEVDIATGTVVVTMAEAATLDQATADKAVKKAGFSLRSFEQVPTAPQANPEK